MKKLVLLAVLLLALVFSVVACDTTTDGNTTEADTTVAATTEEATTEEATTEEATTEEATTEEAATEEATTEEATTEEATTEEATTEEATTEEATTEEATEPDAPKTYEVDLNTTPISGSWPAVMDGTNVGFPGAPVAALHYGSLNLGELDLSQYSKVTITYTTPAGELNGSNFDNEYEATGKRVLLLNTASDVQAGSAFELLPAEGAIITSTHYDKAPTTGQTMTVEIDLTAIDYNGQVYLTFDARNANNEFGALGYLVYVASVVFA